MMLAPQKPKEPSKRKRTVDKPPDFVVKLHAMFGDLGESYIAWESGKILIPGPSARLAVVLPRYFRHGNFTSFQRQLNNFGFHKRVSESSARVRVYAREDMLGCPPEALLDLRRRSNMYSSTAKKHASGLEPLPRAKSRHQDALGCPS